MRPSGASLDVFPGFVSALVVSGRDVKKSRRRRFSSGKKGLFFGVIPPSGL